MNSNEKNGTIVILATGGTIAGIGERGKVTGYKPGQVTAEELIGQIPELQDVAHIEAIQVCNIKSDNMNSKIWVEIANIVNEKSKDENVKGFVITHGTDVMEETAYFLNLTIKTDKPVVLTGAMRPSTAISPDGPMNLYEAVIVASSEASKGRGVLIVFSDAIYSARYMIKTNLNKVYGMAGGRVGEMGSIIDRNVYYNYHIDKLHTINSEFDISNIKSLKKVQIVYFHAEANTDTLETVIKNSDGVVIVATGMGEYSKEFASIIQNAKKPIVISTRVANGFVPKDALNNDNAISAMDLPPQKAAILLRLALTFDKTNEEIKEIFDKY